MLQGMSVSWDSYIRELILIFYCEETDRDTLPKYKTPLARSVFNLLDLGLNADPMHQWDYHIPMNFSTE